MTSFRKQFVTALGEVLSKSENGDIAAGIGYEMGMADDRGEAYLNNLATAILDKIEISEEMTMDALDTYDRTGTMKAALHAILKKGK